MLSANPNRRLPRSAPEIQGIPTTAINAFLDEVDANIHDLHSLMLLRHGYVVAEGWWTPYASHLPHMLYSLSKSFTSSAVGFAVDDGLLTIDDPVLLYFPDETPSAVSDNLAAMRVRHLLSMNTGHDADLLEHLRDSVDPNWARTFLAIPVDHEPGTHFLYNSGASYLLSAIVQRLTGEPILDYLRPRLFEPLGILNPTWQACPRGINTGGWGLNITTEDIACFGQMYLQQGVWNDQQILPKSWVELATSYHSDNSSNDDIDWQQGYGFQFWRCQHNAYRGDGAFGQFCVIMPEQDAVFVTTAGVENMQAVLDLLWKHLLPAMESVPVPENVQQTDKLDARLKALNLAPRPGTKASMTEPDLAGKQFTLQPNALGIESLALDFTPNECVVNLRDGNGQHSIHCGRQEWHRDTMALQIANEGLISSKEVAASATWSDDDTLVVELCLYETPHTLTLTCNFNDDAVTVNPQVNVSFDEEGIPQFQGHVT